MKNRENRGGRPARRRFAPHPLSLALCLAFAEAALALPQGGTVVAGQATVTTPRPNNQVIDQTTQRAIIDWRSFSIGQGEHVRFNQPNSSASTLNRVTGFDPSYILGRMTSNGRVFLVNPYGVVFGAGARVDVGGLVVSTLSLANSDYLAGRYSLTSSGADAPVERGAIRNDGILSAPGGTIALAAPVVVNQGTISAERGRVGLAAVNAVSVDVEGDGLVFFQASASEARNRLEQLGRVRADGGSIEMRAIARGAFADTVLNLDGVVQARSLGTQGGRIVIDGGGEGAVRVAGTLDASGRGAGERGGSVTLEGRDLRLDATARIDAAGDSGGGSVRIGGGFHGAEPGLANATTNTIAAGARIDADALSRGDGGTVAVWADGRTHFEGTISARGGASGGDGGFVEVSGRDSLAYRGRVDTRAPLGRTGTLLLDPTDITISNAPSTGTMTIGPTFSDTTTTPSNLDTTDLQAQLVTSNVIVDTTSGLAGAGTITVANNVNWGNANSLTLRADSTITVNGSASITNTSTGNLLFNSNGGVVLNGSINLDGGSFTVGDKAGTGRALSFTMGAGATISTADAGGPGGNVDIQTSGAISTRAITTSGGTAGGIGQAAGSVTLDSSGGTVSTLSPIIALGGAASGVNQNGGAGGAVTIVAGGLATLGANVTTTGGAPNGTGTKGPGGAVSLQGGGVTVAAAVTVNADDATIAVDGSGGAIQLNTSTLTTTNAGASAIVVRDATTVGLGDLTTGGAGTTTLGVGGDITGAVTQAGIVTTGTLAGSTAGSVSLGGSNVVTSLGNFTSDGAFTFNRAGALSVGGAVTTSNNGVASITASGGALTVGVGGSVAGAGVTLTSTGAGNDLTLNGAVNGNAGTVTLVSGRDVAQSAAGTINTSGALTVSAAAGTITLDDNNTIGSLGNVTRGGAFTLNDAGGLTLTGDVTAGATNNAVSITTSGGALALGAQNITTTGAGTLALTGVGVTQTTGTLAVGGATSVDAGTGSIDLQSTTNAFGGPVTLAATGANAAIRDADSLTLATLAGLGGATGLTAIAGTTLTTPGGGFTTTGAIDLRALGGTLATNGALSGGSIALTGRDGITIADDLVSAGALSLTTTNSAINQTAGTITAGGATTFAAGSGSVTLGQANAFASIGGTGGAVSISEASAGGVALDAINAASLAVDTSGGNGAVTQNGAAVVAGATTVNAGSGSIALLDAGNDFGAAVTLTTSGASAAVRDANALQLGSLAGLGGATDLTAIAGTTLTLPGGFTTTGAIDLRANGAALATNGALSGSSIALTGRDGVTIGHNLTTTTLSLSTTNAPIAQTAGTIVATGATTFGAGSGAVTLNQANTFGSVGGSGGAVSVTDGTGGLALDAINASSLTVTASGNVTQNAGSTVSGATSVNAGANSVLLTAAGNNFGSVGTTGTTVSISDSNALALDTISATTLAIDTSAGNGALSQASGNVVVAGATTVNTGSGAVNLTTASNNFASIAVTGGAVSIADANLLTLAAVNAASLAVTTNGAITQAAPLLVAGAASFNAGAANPITLLDAANSFGSFGAIGGAVQVRESGALALDAINASSLFVDTSPGNGALTQNAAAVVAGSTVVNSGSGPIALTNAANDFANAPGNSFSGGAIAVRDANALTITTLASGPNQDVSVVAGGALTLPGAITTGSGNITLSSGASLTTPGALSGNDISLTGNAGVTIANAINATGNLSLTTTNSAVTQTAGAIVAAGTTTVAAGAGSVTLAQPANDFGNVNVASAGNVNVADQNGLGFAAAASGSVVANAGGVLTSSGAISGTSVSLTGNAGISLGHNLTASAGPLDLVSSNSAITQSAGAISALAGLTTVSAGSGDITLTQAGNDFSNAFGVNTSGGAVRLRDANALVIAGLAGGANRDLSLTAGTTISGASGNIDTGSADLTISAGAGFTTFGTLRGSNVTLGGGSGGLLIFHDVAATGNLALTTTNAAIGQAAGTITAAGTTTASAGSGAITLAQPGNNFNGFGATGGAVTVVDATGLALAAVSATSLTIDSSAGNGAITQTGPAVVSGTTAIGAGSGAVTLGNAGNDFASIGVAGGAVSLTDANAVVLNASSAGSLAVNAGGVVSQAGALTVAGATSVNAGANAIALANPANNFGGFAANGGAVAVADINAIALGAISASSLAVNAGGAVTQTAAATVSGNTTVAAGANAVTLGNAGNDFGNVAVSGGAVTVTDSNALALGVVNATSLAVNTAAGNGAVTQTGAATVSGATTANAGSGAVSLTNAGNNFASVAATGGAIAVTDVNALVLAGVSAASLSINTSAGNGAISQTAPLAVAGATTLNAGAGAVTLGNAGNDFGSVAVTAGALALADANALVLTGLTIAANQPVTVSAGGTLTLPATPIDTGSAALSLTSGGPLATAAALRGTGVTLSASGALSLGHNVTSLGALALTTTNAPISQGAGAIVAAGPATVTAGSGDITLAGLGNDFQAGVSLAGGAISVRDVNDLTVSALAGGSNQPISLVAGGSLVLPAGAIDTGSAALTLQALGGTLVINGALSGGVVTLTGAAGLTLAANVTSSGDQIYTTAVQLAGDVALNASASRIDLQGGVNGAGNDLTLTSTSGAADAIRTGAAIAGVDVLAVNGNATLGGNVTTSGNQTYAGTLTLAADLALAAGAGRIDLQGPVAGAGRDLTLSSSNVAADAIRAGTIGGVDQLTVSGRSTLAGGVATTGAQSYSDTVTLGGTASFSASSLAFGNGIAAGAFDLGLQADTLSLAGTVAGTGAATIAPQTATATVGVAGGAGTLQLSQATLDRFATFANLTIGRSDGSGDLTFGNLTLPVDLGVRSASGDATFTGTVSSAAGLARNLTVTTGATTTFAGTVGGAIGSAATLGSLSVAGVTQLDASTNSNGAQAFGGAVSTGADATLSAGALSFATSLDVGSHAVTLLTDALAIGGSATGSGAGNLRVAPRGAAGSLDLAVAGGSGNLQVSQAVVDALAGVPTLAFGRSDGSGAIRVGNLVVPTDLTITSGSGNVALEGTIDSATGPARDLTVSTSGATSIGGAIGAARVLDAVTIAGPTQFGANVATAGAQSYGGAVTLLADSVLSGPTVAFTSSVDGARALIVNAAATSFAGVGQTTPLTSLVTDAAGTTTLGGNVTTTGAQTFNDALVLGADATLLGSTLTLASTVDGARALTLNGATAVNLGGAIGDATPLAGLAVAGPLQLAAGRVTTTGAQSYAGTTTLGAATTLTAPAIAFGGMLDGAFALTLQSAGTASFAGAVGGNTPLASLAANGGGTVMLGGPSIDTSGAQSYSGALQFSGAARLTGSSLTLAGPASGATDLTLQTNALAGATSLAGSGTLTIAPLDPALTIGIAGAAGALQVPQAVLDGATGFAAHVVGRADGSGTIRAGNLTLRADTTLPTASGDLDLAGSVDGAFALALNSGGTTRIGGPIGTTTPLRSVVTDNNAAAADWNGTAGERTTFDVADATGAARVTTTGAQTYNDPLTASVPVTFAGGAITATQATNRFDGTVTGNVGSVDLRSSVDLRLGNLTLANGGNVETDGVLRLAGALQLNGGTLVLLANATPTAIDLTDPEHQGRPLNFGFTPLREASATIVQEDGATLASAVGSLLVVRSPAGGSIQLDRPGNTLLGGISAVSGTLGDDGAARFSGGNPIVLGFVRIASSEIHVAGQPPADGNQTLQQAGVEGDVIKLAADILTTGEDGLIRARLPFNNVQGSQTSIPGITFVMTPTALANGGGFGTPSSSEFIRIGVGGAEGGFITARPNGVSGDTAVIFLGGAAEVRPFYDGNGQLTEIRIFYNGDAPRTPQEAGALAAVIALIEDARHARFEEAVRTENVTSRLRSGVIAEVGAGRPATVGRESIKLPESCEIEPKSLRCETAQPAKKP